MGLWLAQPAAEANGSELRFEKEQGRTVAALSHRRTAILATYSKRVTTDGGLYRDTEHPSTMRTGTYSPRRIGTEQQPAGSLPGTTGGYRPSHGEVSADD